MNENIHVGRIGGSTMAGILGYSPWETPHSVYLKLVGEYQGTPSNAAMERGVALEPVVAAMFAGNHPEYDVETYGLINHPVHDFLTGSPDRVLIDKDTGELVAGLEIKTANVVSKHEWGEEETDEIPDLYLLQCMWYAGLLGVPRWHLAVAFFLSESRQVKQYREYVVNFDQVLYDTMEREAIEFWNRHVIPRNPPEITKADPASVSYYKRRYPYHSDQMWLDQDETIEKHARELLDARACLDKAETLFEALKLKMIARLGECEGVKTSLGNITYRAAKPTRKTDWKAVADELDAPADIIEHNTKEIPGSRRFLLPKMKGEQTNVK